MTQLCTYCGSTYDLLGGHVCYPTIATTSTGMVAQHTYTSGCDGHHPPGPCPATPRPAVRLVLGELDALTDIDLDALADALAPRILDRLRQKARREGRTAAL
jgi:hypothetical protein